ncbi:Protein of unknown function (DUF2887) [Limnospira platensis C1]|nr:Protein of unknown function (DUF2887) [Arthrospira platensis C1]
MKTDKLFYRIFLWQPELIAELVPGIPTDCQFDYSAPVVKEQEQRIDGLFTPVGMTQICPWCSWKHKCRLIRDSMVAFFRKCSCI